MEIVKTTKISCLTIAVIFVCVHEKELCIGLLAIMFCVKEALLMISQLASSPLGYHQIISQVHLYEYCP